MKKTIFFSACAYVFLLSSFCASGAENLKPVYKKTNQTATTTTTPAETPSTETIVKHLANCLDALVKNKITNGHKTSFMENAIITLMTNMISTNFVSSQLLTDTGFRAIADEISESPYAESLNNEIIDALCNKSGLFNALVERYTEYAYQDIENVTCDTLSAIEKDLFNVPKTKIPPLPEALKEYILHKVEAKIPSPYTILTMPSDEVQFYNIKKSIAAIQRSGVLTLWDLVTGKAIGSPQILGKIITFVLSKDGSRLCTATNNEKSQCQSYIQEWDTQSLNANFTITIPAVHLHSITYVGKNENYISALGVQSNDALHCRQVMWKIKQDNTYIKLGSISIGLINEIGHSHEFRYPSETVNTRPILPFLTFTVTGNSKPLYLCKKAIENEQKVKKLKKVKQCPLYSELTEYAQGLVNQKIVERTAVLQQMQKGKSEEQRNLLTNNSITQAQNQVAYTRAAISGTPVRSLL